MKVLKYAMVGFGGIAENRISKEGFALDRSRFKPLESAALVGAFDVSSERKKAVENLGLKWYDSLDQICQDRDIDCVFVSTNNLSHYPIAMKLMEANKHLIIEKPIATTLKHAKKMVDLAKLKKLSLSVDHMMQYNVYNIKAKELIANQSIGDVNDIVLHMEFPYGYTSEEREQWRIANPDEIGGPVGDVASHCLYMAEFLLDDKINTVNAVYTPNVNQLKVEEGAFIRFKTSRQITGSVRVSFSDLRGSVKSIFYNLGYEVYGSAGTIRTYGTLFQLSGHPDEPIDLRLEMDDFSQVKNIQVAQIKNIYQEIINRHVQSIVSGSRMTGEDALHNLELIEKVHSACIK